MKRVVAKYDNLVDLFQDAIDKERDAEAFYRDAAAIAQTDEIRGFLLELAATEHEHMLALTQRLEQARAELLAMSGIMSSYHEPHERDDAGRDSER